MHQQPKSLTNKQTRSGCFCQALWHWGTKPGSPWPSLPWNHIGPSSCGIQEQENFSHLCWTVLAFLSEKLTFEGDNLDQFCYYCVCLFEIRAVGAQGLFFKHFFYQMQHGFETHLYYPGFYSSLKCSNEKSRAILIIN